MLRSWHPLLAALVPLVALVQCGKGESLTPKDSGASSGSTGNDIEDGGGGTVVVLECEGGALVHRPTAEACQHTPPVNGPSGGLFTCTAASQCDVYGWQNPTCMSYGAGATLYCNFDQCLSDSDCPVNNVCTCSGGYTGNGTANVCFSGDCVVDADCSEGNLCALSTGMGAGAGFYGSNGWYCHTAKDQCQTDCDCAAGSVCAFVPTSGVWGCGQGFAG